MKKIYFLLFLLFIGQAIHAQIISIPDANFKAKLLAANTTNFIAFNNAQNPMKIDSNNNGEIEVSEAQQVYYLLVNNNSNTIASLKIADLTGLQYFTNIINFSCQYNKVVVLNMSNMLNLYRIDCSYNLITTLNFNNLPSLFDIDGDYNQIATLNLSAFTSLDNISFDHNLITSFNGTGLVNLSELWLNYNQLPSLNISGMTNLKKVFFSDNVATNFIFGGNLLLNTISCYNNLLTQLNVSTLTNLVDLTCGNNNISNLNLGTLNLNYLACNNNQLTSLDIGSCTNLTYLGCSTNQLTTLNITGLNNLTWLNCVFNQIQTLDLTGKHLLTDLSCNNNQLTSLDIRDCWTLNQFSSQNNNLQSLFIKNGVTQSSFNFNNNPNIYYICADEAEVTTVQSFLTNYGYTATCTVNSYCSFTPGGEYYTIQGSEKLDANTNGCDASDTIFPNLKFSISGSSTTGIVIANTSGNYSIPVGSGNYVITPLIENPTYFTIAPTNVAASFPTDTSPVTTNFCISPNGVHQDVEISILPINPARPGFDANYKLVYKNKGNTIVTGTIDLTFNDAVLDLVTVIPMTTSQSTNTLSWNYSNLLPFESREIQLTFNLNGPTETPPLNNGNQLDYTAIINPLSGDEILYDNTNSLKQVIVGSMDPNDKRCIEGATITPAMVGQYVHYIIRFENTGTFAAENIVVKDIIDTAKFDVNSLVPMSSSHSFVTRITNTNKVEFIFQNINLPFDDANNDGYVAFKIKTKSTLVVGNTFSNAASIYFDYNFPIVTNIATTTIQALANTDFEFSTYFVLAPNPAKEMLNITSKNDVVISSINIYNTLGQLVLVVTEPNNSIDVSSLKTGNYFIKIVSDKGTSNSKFIKE